MKSLFSVLGVLILVSVGCSSVKTTVLDRSQGGCLSKNPRKAIKGVPVMLRVPTHLDVKILQVDYWQPDGKTAALNKIKADMPSRHVESKIIETEKMFFVDPKRVASGSGIYGFTFNSKADDTNPGKGYLSGVAYKAEDTTLAESAALISNIARLMGQPTSTAAQKMAEKTGVITTTRTIAYRKFDINSPCIEQDVRDFCNMYLNDCQPGCEFNPIYPD